MQSLGEVLSKPTCHPGLSPLQRDPEPAAPSRGGSMGRKLPQTRDSHAEQEVEQGRGETAPWDGGDFSGCQTEKGPDSAKRAQNAEGLRGLPSGSPRSESSPASSSGNPLTPGCPLGELRLREGTERR